MEGQFDKRNRHREVTLNRMEPYDNRANRNGRRKRQSRATAILLVSMVLLVAACLGTLYYIIRIDAKEGVTGMEGLKPEEVRGEPVEKEPGRDTPDDTVPDNTVPDNMSSNHTEPGSLTGEGDAKDKLLIVVDPGHGGIDGGSSREGVLEKAVNLEISKRLVKKLEELGFEVLILREDNDTDIDKKERVVIANEAKADAYVSIHQNTYQEKDNEVSGIETYYCEDTKGSEKLASLVQKGAAGATGARDRGLKETDGLYVVREADMPCCLVETCFLTNKKEREAIVTEEYQEKLAQGIADAVYQYFYPDKK